MNFEKSKNLTNKQLDDLISKLCDTRSENQDVVIIDKIKIRNTNLIQQEAMEIESDRISIENDIINGIFETKTNANITPEEMNVLISNGIYDRYINNKKSNESEENIMSDMERELREGLNESNIEDITEEIVQNEEIKVDVLTEVPSEERFQPTDTDATISEETIVFNTGEISEPIEETSSETIVVENIENDTPMTIEEINDVPATTLSISDDRMKNVLGEKYNVSEQDAIKLINVLTRYKNKEKFNVYEELPDIIKHEIDKGLMENGGDIKLRNFFAKTFINDLVSETYLNDEIEDFNKELKEISAPMNNIVGTIMDEYTDELIAKFEEHMKKLSEEIKEKDPEKSEQLIRVANNFNDTYTLRRVLSNIFNSTNSYINKAYKAGRDDWNKINTDFKLRYINITPQFRELDYIVSAVVNKLGYPESIGKTIAVLVNNTVTESMEINTVEEHVYSYYVLNAFFNLNFSANNSKLLKHFQKSINAIVNEIVYTMKPLIQGKRSKSYPKDFVEFINAWGKEGK